MGEDSEGGGNIRISIKVLLFMSSIRMLIWPRAIGLFRGADPVEVFGLRLAKRDDVSDRGTLTGGAVGLTPCAEVD